MSQIRLHLREAAGELPMVCMCCGAPATVIVKKKLAVNPCSMLLLAPLCEEHKRHWSNRLLILWGTFSLLLVSCIGIYAMLANMPQVLRTGFTGLGIAVSLSAWQILIYDLQNSAIHPTVITKTEVILDRVSDAFFDAVTEADSEYRDRRRGVVGRWDDEKGLRLSKNIPFKALEEETRPRRKPFSDAFEE